MEQQSALFGLATFLGGRGPTGIMPMFHSTQPNGDTQFFSSCALSWGSVIFASGFNKFLIFCLEVLHKICSIVHPFGNCLSEIFLVFVTCHLPWLTMQMDANGPRQNSLILNNTQQVGFDIGRGPHNWPLVYHWSLPLPPLHGFPSTFGSRLRDSWPKVIPTPKWT